MRAASDSCVSPLRTDTIRRKRAFVAAVSAEVMVRNEVTSGSRADTVSYQGCLASDLATKLAVSWSLALRVILRHL